VAGADQCDRQRRGRPRVPKLIHKVAEQIMKSSYNDAVKGLEPGMKPEDYCSSRPTGMERC